MESFKLVGLTQDVKTNVLLGLTLNQYVEVYASLKSMEVIYSLACMEVLIVSGVSILNNSVFKNLYKVLRSSIGLHWLLGLGTRKSLL